MNLSIYEIVFGLFARCECRIQIIKHIGRTLAFLWKCLKSIRHRRKSGIDTLKLHHDTLSKTLKKHCLNDTKFKLPCRVLPRPCKLVLQPSYQAHGVREDLQGTHPEHKNKPGEMKAEFVHTQSSRCKTIAVIKRRQQTTISIKKLMKDFDAYFRHCRVFRSLNSCNKSNKAESSLFETYCLAGSNFSPIVRYCDKWKRWWYDYSPQLPLTACDSFLINLVNIFSRWQNRWKSHANFVAEIH